VKAALVAFSSFLLLIIGLMLLQEDFSKSSVNQTASMLAGASFVAIGLISASLAVKNWWKSR
jgi:uncharacterized membrane protein